ncbi:MAG: hypothetical protein AVDCRST_MAG59-4667, partial [uncultured Thermomicrobiales bacterium]
EPGSGPRPGPGGGAGRRRRQRRRPPRDPGLVRRPLHGRRPPAADGRPRSQVERLRGRRGARRLGRQPGGDHPGGARPRPLPAGVPRAGGLAGAGGRLRPLAARRPPLLAGGRADGRADDALALALGRQLRRRVEGSRGRGVEEERRRV